MDPYFWLPEGGFHLLLGGPICVLLPKSRSKAWGPLPFHLDFLWHAWHTAPVSGGAVSRQTPKGESIGKLGVLDTLAPAPSTKLHVPRAESVENPSPAFPHTESHYEFYNSAHGRQLDPDEQPASPIQLAWVCRKAIYLNPQEKHSPRLRGRGILSHWNQKEGSYMIPCKHG